MRNAARAHQRDSVRHGVRSTAQRLAQRPRAVQRRQRRTLTIDVHRNDRQIIPGGQKAQWHHDAVIEFPFFCIGEIHGLHHFAYQAQ